MSKPLIDSNNTNQPTTKTYIPDVGSSNSTTLLPPQNAIATLSFRFIPPLRKRESVFRFSNNATSRIAWSISASASLLDTCWYRPLRREKNLICSRTVRSGKRQSCWRQIPISWRIPCRSVRMSLPATVAYPLVGAIAPVNMLMVVVFPAPTREKSTLLLVS